jgi:hypothetical protein
VIVLIPQSAPLCKVAFLRFLEVSWGIAVALAIVLAAARIARRPQAT